MDSFVQAVVELLAVLVGLGLTVLTGYAAAYVKTLRDKNALLKLALSDARVEQFVQDAVRIAEERVNAEIKRGAILAGNKLQVGQRKLTIALARVLDKVPGISSEEATHLIHAQLSKVGAGASAAVKNVTAAVKN